MKRSERGHSDAFLIVVFVIAVVGGWCSWDGFEHGIQRIACERASCPTPEVSDGR